MSTQAYPLHWPEGQKRTRFPTGSRFNVSPGQAINSLLKEIAMLGGRHIVISSNQRLRKDGLPYSSGRMPDDRGVAVYFLFKDKQRCFACDKWDLMHDNIQAVKKTIEAIRGIQRWGSSEMVDRAFSGFDALPNMQEDDWRVVLHCRGVTLLEEVRDKYMRLRSIHHSDKGGEDAEFVRIQKAWEQAQKEFAAA